MMTIFLRLATCCESVARYVWLRISTTRRNTKLNLPLFPMVKPNMLALLSKKTLEEYKGTPDYLDACLEYAFVLDIYGRWYSVSHIEEALKAFATIEGRVSLSYILQVRDLPIGKEFYVKH